MLAASAESSTGGKHEFKKNKPGEVTEWKQNKAVGARGTCTVNAEARLAGTFNLAAFFGRGGLVFYCSLRVHAELVGAIFHEEAGKTAEFSELQLCFHLQKSPENTLQGAQTLPQTSDVVLKKTAHQKLDGQT